MFIVTQLLDKGRMNEIWRGFGWSTLLHMGAIVVVLQAMGEPPESFNTAPPEFADIKLFTAEALTEVRTDEDEEVGIESSEMPDDKDGMQEAG